MVRSVAAAVLLLALLGSAYGGSFTVPSSRVKDMRISLGFKTFIRTGYSSDVSLSTLPGVPLGTGIDYWGNPIYKQDFSGYQVSQYPDFTSWRKIGNTVYVTTQFEAPHPSSVWVIKANVTSTGDFVPVSYYPVNGSAFGGFMDTCAGSHTPWNSHLGSEEVEPDAKKFELVTDIATLISQNSDITDHMRFWGYYNDCSKPGAPQGCKTLTYQAFRQYLNPYNYGKAWEVTLDGSGKPYSKKIHTLGRRTLELAYVMPDQKTVYMTDDGTNKFFSMYVGDVAGRAVFNAGTLYAARFTQVAVNTATAVGGGSFTIEWIKLGYASQVQLESMLKTYKNFTQIFDYADYLSGTGCPAGFTSINQGGSPECLKLKTGTTAAKSAEIATAAAFFETRRYAAMLGATTEFTKWEGITFAADRMQLFTALTTIGNGMLDGPNTANRDMGGPNHIKLPANGCGCVYSLDVNATYAAVNLVALTCGTNTKDTDAQNSCGVNDIASPDNVAYLDGLNKLLIAEDTSAHQNDVLWLYDLATNTKARIASSPYGSEWTGGYWYPSGSARDLWVNLPAFGGRQSYLTAVIQHPYGESDFSMLNEAGNTGWDAYLGYFGPIPTDLLTNTSFSFQEVPVARGDARHLAYGSSTMSSTFP